MSVPRIDSSTDSRSRDASRAPSASSIESAIHRADIVGTIVATAATTTTTNAIILIDAREEPPHDPVVEAVAAAALVRPLAHRIGLFVKAFIPDKPFYKQAKKAIPLLHEILRLPSMPPPLEILEFEGIIRHLLDSRPTSLEGHVLYLQLDVLYLELQALRDRPIERVEDYGFKQVEVLDLLRILNSVPEILEGDRILFSRILADPGRRRGLYIYLQRYEENLIAALSQNGRTHEHNTECVQDLLQLTLVLARIHQPERLLHELVYKIECMKLEHFDQFRLNLGEVWVLETLLSRPANNSFERLVGRLSQIEPSLSMISSLNELMLARLPVRRYVRYLFESRRTGDIQMSDSVLINFCRQNPSEDLLMRHARAHTGILIYDPLTHMPTTLDVWDADVGGMMTRRASLYDAHVTINASWQLEQLLTPDANRETERIRLNVSDLSQLYERAVWNTCARWNRQNDINPTVDSTPRHILSHVPSVFTHGRETSTVVELAEKKSRMLAPEFCVAFTSACLLEFEGLLRVRIGPAAPRDLLRFPFAHVLWGHRLNMRRFLRLIEELLNQGVLKLSGTHR